MKDVGSRRRAIDTRLPWVFTLP